MQRLQTVKGQQRGREEVKIPQIVVGRLFIFFFFKNQKKKKKLEMKKLIYNTEWIIDAFFCHSVFCLKKKKTSSLSFRLEKMFSALRKF